MLAELPTERRNRIAPPADLYVPRSVILQLGLTLFVLSSFSLLLLPEGNSPWYHRVAYLGLFVGYSIVVLIGLMNQDCSKRIKRFVGVVLLTAPLPIVVHSLHERDMSFRLLEPARTEYRRIVHRGLGLSYPALSDWRYQFQPVLTRERTQVVKSAPLPSHLRYGDVVMLSQMVQQASISGERTSPTSISVFVQHNWGAGASAFVNAVRQFESRVENSGKNQIRKRTHSVHITGADALEFEYVQTSPAQISRQLFVRIGRFVVYFVMSTDNTADCQTFDEFTRSIRVDATF